MASLRTSSTLSCSSSSSSSSSLTRRMIISATLIHAPKRNVIDHNLKGDFRNIVLPAEPKILAPDMVTVTFDVVPVEVKELHVLLEVVSDRVAMHDNVGEQRDNWNTLLLNSINTITLAATAMSGLSATSGAHLALSVPSTILFSAATAMVVIMNKIQPSQLAEEQRNASRLFRQLQASIETLMTLKKTSRDDVNDVMKKILALDRAYPLPLLGAMIEKFPNSFQTSAWWPQERSSHDVTTQERSRYDRDVNSNGWSEELEQEMRRVARVLKNKDGEEYKRLGSLALKVNKALAVSGPLLSGIAAVGSAFGVGSSHGAVVAAAAGALAATVNAVEHGGQVGMVVEMYRYCGGFFGMLGESIESTLEERDVRKRENGEVFEMKVALQLGRSLSQLRELATKNNDEFASKLF